MDEEGFDGFLEGVGGVIFAIVMVLGLLFFFSGFRFINLGDTLFRIVFGGAVFLLGFKGLKQCLSG